MVYSDSNLIKIRIDSDNKKISEYIEKVKREYTEKIDRKTKMFFENRKLLEDYKIFCILGTGTTNSEKIDKLAKVIEISDIEKLKKFYKVIEETIEDDWLSLKQDQTEYAEVDLYNIEPVVNFVKNLKLKREIKFYEKKFERQNYIKKEKSFIDIIEYIQSSILFFILKNKPIDVVSTFSTFTINSGTMTNDLDTVNGYYYLTPEIKHKLRIKSKNYSLIQKFSHPCNIIYNRDEKLIEEFIFYKFNHIKYLVLDLEAYNSIIRETFTSEESLNEEFKNLLNDKKISKYMKKIGKFRSSEEK